MVLGIGTAKKSAKKPFPFALIGISILAGLVMLQVIGFLVEAFSDINVPATGPIYKLIAVFLVVLLTMSLILGKFPIDSPKASFVFLIIIAGILFLLFGVEYVLPELFSSAELFSVADIFG